MNFDYEFLDSGNGLKLERFGNNILIRPEKKASWTPKINAWKADAICQYDQKNTYVWEKKASFNEAWSINYGTLCFELRLSQSKNIGIFPEQEKNWQWLHEKIKQKNNYHPNVLNLFAYTGAATLVAASAGAEVCHVDASKSVVNWAFRNAQLSGLSNNPIRWIVDDALKFMQREIKRGILYDGIILDPPPMGHSKNGIFTFKKNTLLLLELCRRLLKPDASFFLFNCYAMNYTPQIAKELIMQIFKQKKLRAGELFIGKSLSNRISCSAYVRFND